MELKQKTIKGITWSLIDSLAGRGLQFLIGIILARLLSPREFGLIGMIAIFIALSESFVNSGFKSALIQKNNCTNTDYSTVFYFNIILGLFFYIVIYLSAPVISIFFNEPDIELILQVLGLVIVIDSFIIVQKTILYKEINFKKFTKLSIIAAIFSGLISVLLAYMGYGVWALVGQMLINKFFIAALMWIFNKWKPDLVFSFNSFKSLFSFSSKLLISSLLNTFNNNLLYFVIGRFYSTVELGYYTRANQFKSIGSEQLSGVINRVTFPILSSIQNDTKQLKQKYRILIRSIAFLSFHLMIGIAAVSESLIVVLIGEKWLPSAVFLQLLCFSGMIFPINYLNLNLIQVKGKANKYMYSEILKFLLTLPILIFGIYTNIYFMIVGISVISFVMYFINSRWSGKDISYSFKYQLNDILPSLISSLFMGFIIFILGRALNLNDIIKLVIQIFSGFSIVIFTSEIFKLNDYFYLKSLIINKIIKNK